MTTELNLIAALSHNLAEPLPVAQKEALQRAVTKIVALGAHVGVNREQRILLLESRQTSANCWSTWRLDPEKLPETLQPGFEIPGVCRRARD
jgi:hypothetical protein